MRVGFSITITSYACCKSSLVDTLKGISDIFYLSNLIRTFEYIYNRSAKTSVCAENLTQTENDW